MSAKDTVAVILAAGKGTRLHSSVAKVLHRAGGRPLVEHVVRACQGAGITEIFVIVGHQAEDVSAVVVPLGAKAVLQEPQNGTGHAMQVARDAIGNTARYTLVLPGDAPLIRAETLAGLLEAHHAGNAAATLLTANLSDPTGYGRIVHQADGNVAAVVEEKSATPEQRAIREINSSVYCFTLAKLWPCLDDLRPDNAHKELYLTDTAALLSRRGDKVISKLAADSSEILGCNSRKELADVDRFFRQRKAAALMRHTTIYFPETVVVDDAVETGNDTVIEPGVQLLGNTHIGKNCTIRTGSILKNATLGDGVVVEAYTLIEDSQLGNHTVVGPFARLRMHADVRENARIGNFVEVKNSTLHEGAKSMHLTYLGDASIGRLANIGAGTITCNYDGVNKNKTIIGERAFIGSDTALVAPVEVGDGAYIAAGSTITQNVPEDALGIARGTQANKLGWAKARREKMAALKAQKAADAKAAAEKAAEAKADAEKAKV
jgi:bifunctional UDP-N-acetylglucosamine pyrophosphorylase/glucosamine-1-phosphate N-acetyltransferase